MNNSTKYFFNRCFELLHKRAFDSYRIRLHNPYTIFDELNKSIVKLNKKRIKRFDPTISSIGEEAKNLIDEENLDSVFLFGSFSKNQIIETLDSTCIKGKDGRKNRTLSLLCKTICSENEDFKDKLLIAIHDLLQTDQEENYHKLDQYTSWYISQLLFNGYSRKFLNLRLKRCFDGINKKGDSIDTFIQKLQGVFSQKASTYQIIYKIKTNSVRDLKFASLAISEIEKFPEEFKGKKYINEKFTEKAKGEKYLSIETSSCDFWAALKFSNPIIAESIEVNTLNGSDNIINLENQVLVIQKDTNQFRMLLTEEGLDGFYNYDESRFDRFINNFQKLESKPIAREKLRSAIRFYKLGNDSVEIEHKFLNYWIGFEQLFSSVDTEEDSINRIKSFFIAMNSTYYWHRRVNYLLDSVKRDGQSMSICDLNHTLPPDSTLAIDSLNPLLQYRLKSYIALLNNPKSIRRSLEMHAKKLDQHFTRIYRLRNELIHEGRYSIDLQLIAGHLRHYLIFSIEQITNELIENKTLHQLDDVFVYFENLLIRVKASKNIHEIVSIKPYGGYMQ